MSSEKTYYVVTYTDPQEGDVKTLKAQTIYDSPLGIGFVQISDFIFESSLLVVNPQAEDIEKKFKDTKSLHLSLYSILTIEEVGENHEGLHLSKDRSTLHVLPTPKVTS